MLSRVTWKHLKAALSDSLMMPCGWELQERMKVRALIAYGKQHPNATLSFRFRPWVGESVKINKVEIK